MMRSPDDLVRQLYVDDRDYEYHQDYRGGGEDFGLEKILKIAIPTVLLVLGLIYTVFHSFNDNRLPISQSLWNFVVYVTPLRFLELLDDELRSSSVSGEDSRISRTHAIKSESMRRLLGLDRGIMNTVAQASRRRLSSLPGLHGVAQSEDGRPAGLGNWDNSCYQNSVLQGLASLDSLGEYLVDPADPTQSDDVAENANMKMVDSLRVLISRLNDPLNNGKRIWTPATLKSMSSWQQQDAQEYFSKVLDEVDKEVAKAGKSMQSKPGLETYHDTVDGTDTLRGKDAQQRLSSLRNPLEGLLAQRVGCTRCGFSEGLSMIPFNCLTVPLGKAWYYNISECLDEYTKLELIEGVECGKCTLLKTQRLLNVIIDRIKDSPDDNPVRKSTMSRLETVTEALEDDDYDDKTLTEKCKIPPKNRMSSTKSRQAVIARPPKSLAVHVNRSLFNEMTGELKKNYAEVRFPRTLDLGPWCLGSSGAADEAQFEEWLLDPGQSMIAGRDTSSRLQGPIYELRAVVTHYGRHENGHYIAYRKHPVPHGQQEKDGRKEQWWRLSDDDVMKVTEENVLSQGGVFMLFYDCVEPARSLYRIASTPPCPSASNTLADVAIAVDVPLPADDDSDLLNGAENEDGTSTQASGDYSVANSLSDEEEESVENYRPAKAIVIPPYIHSSGTYHKSDGNHGGVPATGNMVMV